MANQLKPTSHKGKKALIMAMAVVAVIVSGLGTWWLLKTVIQEDSPDTSDNTISIPEPTATDNANTQARTGDLDGAYVSMDKAITDQSSSDKKQELTLQKALIAYNAKDYKSALNFAMDAEKIKEGLTVSQVMAMAAGKLGNTSLAIQYWQKAITQLNPEDAYYSDDKASAENAVQQLQDGTWQG